MNKQPHEKITRNEIVIKLLNKGFSQSEIARMLDTSRQRIHQIIKKESNTPQPMSEEEREDREMEREQIKQIERDIENGDIW